MATLDTLGLAEGPYAPYIRLFVEWKMGKGLKLTDNLACACRSISRSLSGAPDASGLDEPAVRAVLDPVEGESRHVRGRRVTAMRQLCAFMESLGIPCWQVPPRYLPAEPRDFRPYVLSDSDIDSLVRAADSLAARNDGKASAPIYPALVRLLLSCGLRISEALSLEVGDIGTGEDGLPVLSVTNSKNGVSRLVPVAESVAARLRALAESSDASSGPLFASPFTGRPWAYETVRKAFRLLYGEADVRTWDGGLPRIHDLRHTFCCRSLDRMLASGMSEREAVPILAAYVGHVNYVDTERYLHLTRHDHEAFVESERALGSLIPGAGEAR